MSYTSRAILTFIVFVGVFATPPVVIAQCNPATDPGCAVSDGLGPDISIGPRGGSYTIDPATPQTVTVTIRFTDADPIDRDSLRLTWSNSSGGSPAMTSFVWNALSGSTYAFGQCSVQLSSAGDNVLTVRIADRGGNVGTAAATFSVTFIDPTLPIVSTAPHHEGFRDTNVGAATLAYLMPSWSTLGESRAMGLYYNSEQADPTGFVQLDVDVDYRARSEYEGGAVTLQIFQDAALTTAVTTQDAWVLNPANMRQRVGAQWSARHLATGAYTYYADVRVYRSDHTTYKARVVPVRILVLNETASRYGAGWALSGIQRMYPKSAGMLISEGNGVVRYFEKIGCTPDCTWRTPTGDFSRLSYDHSVAQYVRTYPDGGRVTFSTAGLPTSISDRFGRTTTLTWQNSADAQAVPLLARITDPVGKVTSFTYHWGTTLKDITDPAARVASFGYTNADLTQITGPELLQVVYGANHRVTSYTDARGTWDLGYDDWGMVQSITSPQVIAGGNAVRLVERFVSLRAVVTLKPWVTHIQYNWAGAVGSDQVFESYTDAGGHTTKILSDRYGNPLKTIDTAGLQSFANYNEHGQPTSTGNERQTLVYGWNDRGFLVSLSVNDTPVYHASYAGDLLEFENFGGTAGTWYRYGSRGEVVRTWYGTKDDAEKNGTSYQYEAAYPYQLIAATNPDGPRHEWSYDPVSKNIAEARVIRPDGTSLRSSFTYDSAGRPYLSSDSLGASTTTTYDALNRVRRVANTRSATEYGYTGAHLTSITDGKGKIFAFQRNALGWIEQEIFPDDKRRSYFYDLDGQLTQQTDRRGAIVQYAYDAAHRLVSRSADGGVTTFTFPNAYTAVGRNGEVEETVELHRDGTPWKSTYAFGSVRYVFAEMLNEAAGYRPMGLEVQRYANGNLVRTERMSFTEDLKPADPALSLLVNVQDFSGRLTQLAFDMKGQHVKTVFPSGLTQTRSFAADGLLASVRFSDATVNNKLGADYTYDILRRLSGRSAAAGDAIRSYEYDEVTGQFTGSVLSKPTLEPGCDPSVEHCEMTPMPVSFEGYGYDHAGNRTGSGITLEANSNRYRTIAGYTFEYDAEGNVTRKFKTGFEQRLTWNALGQLASVTTNGSTVRYGYAPSGLRFRRTESNASRHYLYHGDDLIMEVDGGGNPVHGYTYLPGTDRPLSVRTNVGTSEIASYFVTEQPGHVTGLLTSSGALGAHYEYKAYGTETSASTADGQPLRYMSREHDFTSGLYYVRNRWYDTTMGRFISEDPIGVAGGLNTYMYANNDPINHLDPSGLQTTPQPGDYYYLMPTVTAVCHEYDWWEWKWIPCLTVSARNARDLARALAQQDNIPTLEQLEDARLERRMRQGPFPQTITPGHSPDCSVLGLAGEALKGALSGAIGGGLKTAWSNRSAGKFGRDLLVAGLKAAREVAIIGAGAGIGFALGGPAGAGAGASIASNRLRAGALAIAAQAGKDMLKGAAVGATATVTARLAACGVNVPDLPPGW